MLGSYPLKQRHKLKQVTRNRKKAEAKCGKQIKIPKVTSDTEDTKVKLSLSFTTSQLASR